MTKTTDTASAAPMAADGGRTSLRAQPRPTAAGGSRIRALVLLAGLVAVTAAAQEGGPGAERVPNTSLLIDLRQGEPAPALSATGVFVDMETQQPAPGLIPYSVNARLWSDGAFKTRYLALPGLAQIEFSAEGNWTFPDNTVLVKNFYLEMVHGDPASRRIVETRFLVNGGPVIGWRGFSYRWNEAGTEAELLPSAATQRFAIVHPEDGSVQQLDYQFPASEDCLRCHTYGRGQVLGVRTPQLNRPVDDEPGSPNQLAALNRLAVFTGDIGDVEGLPRWPDPADPAAPLAQRARAYLASNCSHCHHPGGLRRTDIDLRYATPLDQMGIIDRVSGVDDLDNPDRRLLKPGHPDNSVLLLRTLALDERRMPPLASGVVDGAGTEVLRRWIEDLGPPTAVTDGAATPAATALAPAYPNPFNASTTLEVTLASAGPVSLVVHDVIGRPVRALLTGRLPAGVHRVVWDGRDDRGRPAASGVYLCRLTAGAHTQTQRLALLK